MIDTVHAFVLLAGLVYVCANTYVFQCCCVKCCDGKRDATSYALKFIVGLWRFSCFFVWVWARLNALFLGCTVQGSQGCGGGGEEEVRALKWKGFSLFRCINVPWQSAMLLLLPPPPPLPLPPLPHHTNCSDILLHQFQSTTFPPLLPSRLHKSSPTARPLLLPLPSSTVCSSSPSSPVNFTPPSPPPYATPASSS